MHLDLDGAAAVQAAAEAMAASLAHDGTAVDGFLVQRMAAAGTELLVGVVHDPPSARSSPAARAAPRPSSWATSACA